MRLQIYFNASVNAMIKQCTIRLYLDEKNNSWKVSFYKIYCAVYKTVLSASQHFFVFLTVIFNIWSCIREEPFRKIQDVVEGMLTHKLIIRVVH